MNQLSKQANLVNLPFLPHYDSFPKIGEESCLEKNREYENLLYNSTELSVDCTFRKFQNQAILFLRKAKSSISHNPEVTVPVSYMFLAKKLTYFLLKSIPILCFIFYVICHSVCDQLLPYLK